MNTMNLLKKNCWIFLLIGGVSLVSCVDNQYDLSDVDTDDIVLGDELVLPLGTGVVSASSLIDTENNSEIKVDDQGNYVMRYPGEFEVNTPDQIGLNGFQLNSINQQIPGLTSTGLIPFPNDTDLDLTTESCDLNFTTEGIVRLDSVWFDHTADKSRLSLTLALNNLQLSSGSAELHFNATFPQGYRLSVASAQEGTFTNGTFSSIIPLGNLEGRGKTITLLLDKAVMHPNDQIQYSASIHITRGSQLTVSTTPSLRIDGGITSPDFLVVYGLFDNNFSSDPIRIETNGLESLFNGTNNLLSFADPHILLNTRNTIGIPLTAMLNLSAENPLTGATANVASDKMSINAPTTYAQTALSNLWIGGSSQNMEPSYTFVRTEINNLIKIAPQDILITTNVRSNAQQAGLHPYFFLKNGLVSVDYIVEIPLAPAADFKANTDEIVKDAFDADLIKYLFSSGSVEILGKVTNSCPLHFNMNLIITDETDLPVGINFTPQLVKGSRDDVGVESKVSFTIDQQQMPKMENARNLRIRLDAYCDPGLAGRHLRPSQEIKLFLKVRKSGGIIL